MKTTNKTMKCNSEKGGSLLQMLFYLFFIASVGMNVAFLTGCEALTGLRKSPAERRHMPDEKAENAPVVSNSEAFYLREIAARLGISDVDGKTPGDIAFDIEQRIQNFGKAEPYRGKVLSDEDFSDIKDAIMSDANKEVFAAYHAFIKEMAKKDAR